MSEDNIIRPATPEEKQNFVEIPVGGVRDTIDAFSSKLSKFKLKYARLFQPYDGYSARMDFEAKVKAWTDAVSQTVDKSSIKKIEAMDLEQYGNPDKFELIDMQEVNEDKVTDNTRITVVTGRNINYKCKQRGNGITVFVPTKELVRVEAWVEENYGTGKKKAKEVSK